jgi:inhibitor of KinA sporulation pathway (predicted exonuclease)
MSYPIPADDVPSRCVVIDLEATCSDDGCVPRGEMEIIEIGAVIADAPNWEPLAEFQTFVRPVRNPELTSFCRELTGIEQSDVDAAPPFAAALAALAKWLSDWPNAVFCSWGDYDRKQFHRDCDFHSVDYPLGTRHINLKEAYAARFKLKRGRGLAWVLTQHGLDFDGRPHRALDDTHNITRLLPLIFPAE